MSDTRGRDYVLAPGELGAEMLAFLDRCAEGFTGPTWGHESLDAATMPLTRGAMTSIVARPGHGKTMLMKYLARREMRRIVAEDKVATECVAFLSLEEPSALIGLSLLGSGRSVRDYLTKQVDLAAERDLILRQPDHPLRIVSPYPKNGRRGKAEALTAETAVAAIESLYDGWGQRPTLILVDYLQLLRTGERQFNDSGRQAAVAAAAEAAKEIAIQLDVPVVLGVQAGRNADKHDPPIPTMTDLEWSSSIEQTSDLVLALWRPIRTKDAGGAGMSGQVNVGGQLFEITERLLVIKLLKQRWGMGYGRFAAYLDPVTLEMTDGRHRPTVGGFASHAEPAEAL